MNLKTAVAASLPGSTNGLKLGTLDLFLTDSPHHATSGQDLTQALAEAVAMVECPSTLKPWQRISLSTPTTSGTSPAKNRWITNATTASV